MSDFLLQDDGTIAVLFPLTPPAVSWVAENLPADALFWGSGTVIEHRFVASIVLGILNDGLEVRR